jgi:lipid A 4'-phosphatase
MPEGAEPDGGDREAPPEGHGREDLTSEASPREGDPTEGRTRRLLIEVGGVIAGLVLVSVLIRATGLDLAVARVFYDPGRIPNWWASDRQPWEFLYRFGSVPGIAAGAISLVLLVMMRFRPPLRRHRRACLLFLVVLAIGPGLIVNGIGKEHWGRPRPKHLVEFGGTRPFVPVGLPVPLGGHSFPSGHASIGFYWITLYVLWRNRRPRAARAGLVLGLAAGAAMGFQRIASGSHFLSDVLWAGGIDYVVAIGADRLIDGARSAGGRPSREQK